MKKDYSLISFVLRGKSRKIVLACLKIPKIPREIAKECHLSISNVSNTLPELISKKLVICKNPRDHYYKYYELTNKGKLLLKELNL